jgi:hypothetical protein
LINDFATFVSVDDTLIFLLFICTVLHLIQFFLCYLSCVAITAMYRLTNVINPNGKFRFTLAEDQTEGKYCVFVSVLHMVGWDGWIGRDGCTNILLCQISPAGIRMYTFFMMRHCVYFLCWQNICYFIKERTRSDFFLLCVNIQYIILLFKVFCKCIQT